MGLPVTGILELDSAGLFLCEISTWPKIILKYSCTVSWIIFHIVFTGLSHSGNRGPWLKLNGGPKTISFGDFAGTINNFLQSGTGPYTFRDVKINGAPINLSTGHLSHSGRQRF